MKIKFLLATLAVSAFLCVPAQAQDEMETRHEFGISYGTVPNSRWLDVLTDIIPAMFGEDYDNYKCVGPIGLEYFHHTSKLIGVGAVAVFTTNSENGFYNNIKDSHFNRTYFTFMPAVKFNWLRKEHWGLYSKVALGVTYAHINHDDYDTSGQKVEENTIVNDLIFNFQGTAIGIEAGGVQVRGFAEFGLGEQGIALAGVRYKF